MSLSKSLSICSLETADAAAVALFIKSQPPKYVRFFYALGANETEIAAVLSAAERDVYEGIFWRGALVGIFMLRGWDEGYEIPSFGVLIDEKYKGGALMRLALDAAKIICRFSGAKKMMAKVHPENISPRGARTFGLHQIDVEAETGNIIYHMEL